MAEVHPFRGIRYRLERPDDAGQVVAPPYDVINPTQREELEARDPRNIVRLELPRDEPGDQSGTTRYAAAATRFRHWLETGVLARDNDACLYVYGQRYQRDADGPVQERLGLLGALKVEPYEAGVVLPHEQTFPKHKEDRFRLLCAAEAQFSPIFGLYSATGQPVRATIETQVQREPDATAVDPEGVEHRLWAVSDAEFAGWVAELFAGKQVFIADGHHRYETALRYRDARRAAGAAPEQAAFDYVMTFLVEMDDPGLVLLPTHRLVRKGIPEPAELRSKLEPHFHIEEIRVAQADELQHHQIGVVLPGGTTWRLTLRDPGALARLDQEHSDAWRDLDVVVLHRLLFAEVLHLDESEIVYTRDPQEARDGAVSGEFAASFVLPFPQVEELKLVAGAGDKMPQKSTYFWPKAISGLVIYEES